MQSVTIDTRIKLGIYIIVNLLIFELKTILLGGLMFAFVCFLAILMGQGKIVKRYLITYLVLAIISYGCVILPAGLMSIISILTLFMRVMLPVMLFATAFIETTTVGELIAAMYAMHMPKAIVITFAMTLRFFPTFKEEIGMVYDAMKLRGLGLSLKNVFKRPGMMFEAVVIPIVTRSMTVAEELSASAVTRGIDNPGKRTTYIRLKTKASDWVLLLVVILYGTALMVLKFLMYGRLG